MSVVNVCVVLCNSRKIGTWSGKRSKGNEKPMNHEDIYSVILCELKGYSQGSRKRNKGNGKPVNHEEIYSVVLCELNGYSPGPRIKQSFVLEIKYAIVTK
jgi:hypothetical protein